MNIQPHINRLYRREIPTEFTTRWADLIRKECDLGRERLSTLRNLKERLPSWIPQEKFSRMIFEKKFPWASVLCFSTTRIFCETAHVRHYLGFLHLTSGFEKKTSKKNPHKKTSVLTLADSKLR